MLSSSYTEYELPRSFDNFIRERIKWSSHLFKKILATKDISMSRTITFLPIGLDIKFIEGAYESGGIANYEITRNWWARKIQELLEAEKNNILLFQYAGKPQDIWIKELKLPVVFFENSALITISCCDELNLEKIVSILDEAENFWHVALGVLTSIPNLKIISGTELQQAQIDLLADNAQHLLLSAFDEEGYIICSFDK
jgi:hypothetical protein